MTEDQLDNWFSYHAPDATQLVHYDAIRKGARAFADVVNRSCPESADKTAAIRKIREATMTANASVACGGK